MTNGILFDDFGSGFSISLRQTLEDTGLEITWAVAAVGYGHALSGHPSKNPLDRKYLWPRVSSSRHDEACRINIFFWDGLIIQDSVWDGVFALVSILVFSSGVLCPWWLDRWSAGLVNALLLAKVANSPYALFAKLVISLIGNRLLYFP